MTGFVPRPWRGTNTFQEACWAWRRLPVPVIAAVHGHCLGGGLQLALAADFRFATPESQWSVLEGKWGIIPDMTGVRTLAQLVGIDTAKRLTMTAEIVSGKDALDLGLVTGLDADPVAAALDLAEQLKGRSPDQLAAAKRVFDDTWSAGARRTFARERVEQAWLLAARNTKVAREAAFEEGRPGVRPPEPMRFQRTARCSAWRLLWLALGPWVLLAALGGAPRPGGARLAAPDVAGDRRRGGRRARARRSRGRGPGRLAADPARPGRLGHARRTSGGRRSRARPRRQVPAAPGAGP